MSLADESKDLTVHVNVCAERYRGIEERFESLENKVDTIHTDVTEGNKTTRNIVIASTVTIVLSILGLIVTVGVN